MKAFENLELWWVTGAQLLYGGDAVVAVDGHSKEMVEGLNASGNIPVKIVYKGTANSSKEVEQVMLAANNDEKCVGVITWMHTFSPAKMWIKGLQALQKPLLHFHTQYNAEIPWDSIDMDFMNLNQSAHGDIEFGHICTRMRIARKVICGYWKDQEAQQKIAVWARVAAGVADAKNVRCLMFGMNMNNVAVTDGDRVEFEQRLGYHVDYYPVSSLMEYFKKVTDAEADELVEEYKKLYTIKIDESGEAVYWEKVKNAAKAEIALRRVLKDEGATAFTTNFDDLGDANIDDPNFCGFDQIPGLASQRLMAEGIGFGAEGDWKTACLYRTLYVIQQGMPTGCSFLEDYTLNFAGSQSSCLQSHMLEVCPLIASDKPKLEVHFLGIGIRKQVVVSRLLSLTLATASASSLRRLNASSQSPCLICLWPVPSGYPSPPSRLVLVPGFLQVVLTTAPSLTTSPKSTGKTSLRWWASNTSRSTKTRRPTSSSSSCRTTRCTTCLAKRFDNNN